MTMQSTKSGGLLLRGLELRGAYGRPTSMEDWRSGKDFKIIGGPYCSNRDIEAMRKEGFQILEFTNSDGSLVERLIISQDLENLLGVISGTFTRVEV